MKALRYLSGLFKRCASELSVFAMNLYLCAFPVISAILIITALTFTSQGHELLDTMWSGIRSLTTSLSLLYSVFTLWLTASTALQDRSRINNLSARILPAVLAISPILPIALAPRYGGLIAAILILIPIAAVITDSIGKPRWSHLLSGDSPSFEAQRPKLIAVTLVIGFTIGVVLSLNPVAFSRLLGSTALLNIGLSFWSLLLTMVFVVAPRRVGLPAAPWLMPLIVIAFAFRNDNHAVNIVQDRDQASLNSELLPYHNDFDKQVVEPTAATFRSYVKQWLLRNCYGDHGIHWKVHREDEEENIDVGNSDMPCPVFFVSASGGGLRAALWTADILENLNRKTDGDFIRQAFSVSAVSGSSLGVMAVLGALSPQHRVNEGLVSSYLQDDFLAPTLAGLFFPDAAEHFLPFHALNADRARFFELGLEQSWREVFRNDAMRQDFRDFWSRRPAGDLPAVFLNSTNVESGDRFVISNVAVPYDGRGDEYFAYDTGSLYAIKSIPMSAAVHLSARFAYVSPAATIMGTLPSYQETFYQDNHSRPFWGPWGLLVDGGYYDNYGIDTTMEVIHAFMSAASDLYAHGQLKGALNHHPEPIAITITNDTIPRVIDFDNNPLLPPPSRPRGQEDDFLTYFGSKGDFRKERDKLIRAISKTALPPLNDFSGPVSAALNAGAAHGLSMRRELFWELLSYDEHRPLQHVSFGREAITQWYNDYSFANSLYLAELWGKLPTRFEGDAGNVDPTYLQSALPALGWTLEPRSADVMDWLSRSTYSSECFVVRHLVAFYYKDRVLRASDCLQDEDEIARRFPDDVYYSLSDSF